jgi:glutamate dehydrogenase (NADP+)
MIGGHTITMTTQTSSDSGLAMKQNSIRMASTEEELETKLRDIMVDIHANIAGFIKVADAMLAYGVG